MLILIIKIIKIQERRNNNNYNNENSRDIEIKKFNFYSLILIIITMGFRNNTIKFLHTYSKN